MVIFIDVPSESFFGFYFDPYNPVDNFQLKSSGLRTCTCALSDLLGCFSLNSKFENIRGFRSLSMFCYHISI